MWSRENFEDYKDNPELLRAEYRHNLIEGKVWINFKGREDVMEILTSILLFLGFTRGETVKDSDLTTPNCVLGANSILNKYGYKIVPMDEKEISNQVFIEQLMKQRS
jgi:hypothetical protein